MAAQIDQMIEECLNAGKQAPSAAPVRPPLAFRTFNTAFKQVLNARQNTAQTPAASPTHFPTPRDTPAATPLREHIPAQPPPTSPNVQQLKSELAAERKLNKSQGLKLITRDRKILKQKETIDKQTIEIRDVKKAARKEAAESKKTIGQQGRTIKRQERTLQKTDAKLRTVMKKNEKLTKKNREVIKLNLIYKQENRHLNRMLATKDKTINHLVQREKKLEKAFNKKLKKVAAECEVLRRKLQLVSDEHKKTTAKLRGLPSAAVYARERRQYEEHCQELEETIDELRARLEERKREQANVNSAGSPAPIGRSGVTALIAAFECAPAGRPARPQHSLLSRAVGSRS